MVLRDASVLRKWGIGSAWRGGSECLVPVWLGAEASAPAVGRSMSAALLRRGLELLGPQEKGVALKKKSDGKGRPALPSSNKTGVRRRVQRARLQEGRKDKATVKGKVVKSAIDEYRRQQGTGNLQKNLQYMLATRFVTDGAVTKQIQSQNRGRKASDRPPEKPKEKAESSVFSDADFRRFEQEYFGSRA